MQTCRRSRLRACPGRVKPGPRHVTGPRHVPPRPPVRRLPHSVRGQLPLSQGRPHRQVNPVGRPRGGEGVPVPDIPRIRPAPRAASSCRRRAAGRSTAAVSSRRVGRPAGADTRRSGQASPVLGRGLITAFVGRPTTVGHRALPPTARREGHGGRVPDRRRAPRARRGSAGLLPAEPVPEHLHKEAGGRRARSPVGVVVRPPSRYRSTAHPARGRVGRRDGPCEERPGHRHRFDAVRPGRRRVARPARGRRRLPDTAGPPVPSPATGSRTVVRPPAAGGVSVRAGLTHAAAYARRAKTRTGSRDADSELQGPAHRPGPRDR